MSEKLTVKIDNGKVDRIEEILKELGINTKNKADSINTILNFFIIEYHFSKSKKSSQE